ncbi:hypothetical protein M404DRAFT_158085 [Pisolithus tinctorius Marx 270]|uniref:Uncharacterized protein n=1 Tax=Pisolithus tinctorius Marx 270 TaxID=870435 RepID=A0A0C3NS35_PISTI|nr:hypothetical protein M404DRAFT_158085 [Pisolithus tinctorius Marx 270]
MCINSCTTFVSPYAHLDICLKVGYNTCKNITSGGVKHPHTIFHTIPIGPQLQALWQHPNTANKMHYCKERTQQVFDKLLANDGFINAFDDIFCGSAYIHGICDGTITPDDTLLMISINGAQLFESRESDC